MAKKRCAISLVIEALKNGAGGKKKMTEAAAKLLLAKEGKKVIKETIEGMSNFASDNINNNIPNGSA